MVAVLTVEKAAVVWMTIKNVHVRISPNWMQSSLLEDQMGSDEITVSSPYNQAFLCQRRELNRFGAFHVSRWSCYDQTENKLTLTTVSWMNRTGDFKLTLQRWSSAIPWTFLFSGMMSQNNAVLVGRHLLPVSWENNFLILRHGRPTTWIIMQQMEIPWLILGPCSLTGGTRPLLYNRVPYTVLENSRGTNSLSRRLRLLSVIKIWLALTAAFSRILYVLMEK